MTCTMAEKRGKEKAGKIKMIASLPTAAANHGSLGDFCWNLERPQKSIHLSLEGNEEGQLKGN